MSRARLFSQVEFLRDDCIRGHWFWSHVRRDIKSRLAQQWTLMNELHETFLVSIINAAYHPLINVLTGV